MLIQRFIGGAKVELLECSEDRIVVRAGKELALEKDSWVRLSYGKQAGRAQVRFLGRRKLPSGGYVHHGHLLEHNFRTSIHKQPSLLADNAAVRGEPRYSCGRELSLQGAPLELLDIGLGGLRARLVEPVQVGQTHQLDLNPTLRLRARVAWVADSGKMAGFTFINLSAADREMLKVYTRNLLAGAERDSFRKGPRNSEPARMPEAPVYASLD